MTFNRIDVCVLRTVLLCSVLTLHACSNDSGTPSTPSSPSPTGLAIRGLAAPLTRGQSVALAIDVILPDGTKQLVSPSTWRSSDTTVATVSETGVVTAVSFGGAEISVRALNLETTAHVSVPLRVKGHVHETAPTVQATVAGAQIATERGAVLGSTDQSGVFDVATEIVGATLVIGKQYYDSATLVAGAADDNVDRDVPLLPTLRYVTDQLRTPTDPPTARVVGKVPVHRSGKMTVSGSSCPRGCSASAMAYSCGTIRDGDGTMLTQVHGGYDWPAFNQPVTLDVGGGHIYTVELYGCDQFTFAPHPEYILDQVTLRVDHPY